MMKAITAGKKNDHLDARTIADLLRCDLLPRSYMAPVHIRELRYDIPQKKTPMQSKEHPAENVTS
jgi:hypothetical protein